MENTIMLLAITLALLAQACMLYSVAQSLTRIAEYFRLDEEE